MKNILLLFFMIINSVMASESLIINPSDSLPTDKFLFTKNHLSVSLMNGFTRSTVIKGQGENHPKAGVGIIQALQLNYTINFSDNVGFTAGAGIGAFPINLSYDNNQYTERLWEMNPFFRWSGQLDYRHKINDRLYLNNFLGYGSMSTSSGSTMVGFHNQDGHINSYSFSYREGWKPFIFAGAGISKVLKNHDLLNLNLFYNYSLANIYRGTYTFNIKDQGISTGTITDKGHFIGTSLAYVWTKAEKTAFNYQRASLSPSEKRAAIREIKKGKRKIDPGSLFVIANGGISFHNSSIKDPQNIHTSAINSEAIGGLFLEYNLNKNLYAETGLSIVRYGISTNISFNNINGKSSGGGLSARQINIGFGKRLIGRNNYNYLNLNSGIALSFATSGTGLLWNYSGGSWSNGNDSITFNNSIYGVNNIFPLLYLGASKDLRITRNFYLSFIYRYHQGFIKIHELRRTYTTTSLPDEQQMTASINGSYHSVFVAGKYNFGNVYQKQVKKERKVFPKGSWLVFAGPHFGRTRYKESSQQNNRIVTRNRKSESLMAVVGTEYFIKEDLSLEGLFSYRKVYPNYDTRFDIVTTDLGVRKRFNYKQVLNIINIDAGASLGAITNIQPNYLQAPGVFTFDGIERHKIDDFSSDRMSGNSMSLNIADGDTIFQSYSEYKIQRRFVPTIYLGVSRDFRLSEKMILGIGYRYHFGLFNVYSDFRESFSKDYQINTHSRYIAHEYKGTTSFNGTNSALTVNLKYLIR
jgi:hypothetical protein